MGLQVSIVHGFPLGAAVCWQPATGSQVSVVHGFASVQLSAVPAVHTPAWQVSTPLQTFPSLHRVPFGTAACWPPATGSHVSVVQTFLSSQLSAVPAVHTPALHVSAPLHAFPSLQAL